MSDPLLGAASGNGSERKPIKFPMPFKEVLRRCVGGRSVGVRMNIFRRYWAFKLKEINDTAPIHIEPISSDEGRLGKANEMIEKFAREGVDSYWYNSLSVGIPEWRKQNRIQQRRNAAKVRWQKKSKKSLGAK